MILILKLKYSKIFIHLSRRDCLGTICVYYEIHSYVPLEIIVKIAGFKEIILVHISSLGYFLIIKYKPIVPFRTQLCLYLH